MNSVSKVYQIRFNTHSKDDSDRWRLIENGNETIVAHIIVDGHTYTTKDWMEDINDFKWHISCVGYCEIKNNVAYIKTVKEENVMLRHILKTISYRFLGTLTTVTVAYSLGASLEMSSLLGVGELVLKPAIYFLHERAWYKFASIKKKI